MSPLGKDDLATVAQVADELEAVGTWVTGAKAAKIARLTAALRSVNGVPEAPRERAALDTVDGVPPT